jgi:hypothetical protein
MSVSPITWASTPLFEPSKTKLSAYKSSETDFIRTKLQPNHIHAGLGHLKITYGCIPRCSLTWGPSCSSPSTSPASHSLWMSSLAGFTITNALLWVPRNSLIALSDHRSTSPVIQATPAISIRISTTLSDHPSTRSWHTSEKPLFDHFWGQFRNI